MDLLNTKQAEQHVSVTHNHSLGLALRSERSSRVLKAQNCTSNMCLDVTLHQQVVPSMYEI